MLSDDFDPLKEKMLQVLDREGKVAEASPDPGLGPDVLKEAYRTMVLARIADEKAVVLQRQGRLGAYPPNRGQEAASLGPAMAIGDDDWLVWAFRELAGLIWKKVPLADYYLYWMGNEEGSHYPEGIKVTPACIPVGSQLPYAVGIAMASKYRKEKAVTLAYCGDGATSEGDFHEALNAAAVFKAPVIFVVQNNQWAISVPRSRQTASATIAQKAIAYGMPGILVDGNDLLGMYAATREAVERARNGGGPTLIEAYTYRLGNHTTSDDARKYREDKDLREWEAKDPLTRLRAYLLDKGIITEDGDKAVWEEMREFTEKAVQEAEAHPKQTLDDVFRYTYEDMPANLKEQLEELRKDMGGEK